MRERYFFICKDIKKYTEGVALSGMQDLIRTYLWRDQQMAPKGQGRKTEISQAKGQSMSKYVFAMHIQGSSLY